MMMLGMLRLLRLELLLLVVVMVAEVVVVMAVVSVLTSHRGSSSQRWMNHFVISGQASRTGVGLVGTALRPVGGGIG